MSERIAAFAIIAVGVAIIAYAIVGRLLRFHRQIPWQGGGHVTLFEELCIGLFFLSMGLAMGTRNGAWIIPIVAAWIAGSISQRRAQQRYLAGEEQLRATNAAKHPGVFDAPPPVDPDATNHEEFDLFDAGACTYLGRISRRDLKSLIARHADIPEQGPNDLFMLCESLELFPAGELSDELTALLKRAFDERDFLVLRWMPPAKH